MNQKVTRTTEPAAGKGQRAPNLDLTRVLPPEAHSSWAVGQNTLIFSRGSPSVLWRTYCGLSGILLREGKCSDRHFVCPGLQGQIEVQPLAFTGGVGAVGGTPCAHLA